MTDMEMLSPLCGEIKNYFVRSPRDKLCGVFTVSGGQLLLPDSAMPPIAEGQYFRVRGSLFNDGVWRYPSVLTDEVFCGEVWLMALPNEVIALAGEIALWVDKYGDVASSPYQAESFGGYSYTMRGASRWKNDTSGASSDVSWQSAFRRQLNKYRRMRE